MQGRVPQSIVEPSRVVSMTGHAEVELCREAWLSIAGSVPHEAEQTLARNECFFALLLLLEHELGARLVRWRIEFADDGSRYRSRVWIRNGGGELDVHEGHHDSSLTRSMLAVVNRSLHA
jgi:hypothetical protein